MHDTAKPEVPPPAYNAPMRQPYAMEDADDEGISIDFGRIFEAVKKYFWLILLFIAAGVVGAIAYLNTATPIYQSFALLKVEQRVMDAAPNMGAGGGIEDLRAVEVIKTIEQSFLSRTLMERVARKLNLVERPEFLGPRVPEAERSEMACVSMLLRNTTAMLVRGTRLIRVAFDHPEPEITREIVDTLILEYMANDSEQRLRSAGGNISYLIAERDNLEKKLTESEQQLAAYTQQLGSISVDSELNLIAEQLQQLNARLTIAKADRLRLESDFEQIQEVRDDPRMLLNISSINTLPEIQSLRQQINALDAELGKLFQRYGPRHPAATGFQSQREALVESLHAEALRAPRMIELNLRAAVQNEKSLERETAAQERKTMEVKELSIEAKVIERQIESDKLAFQAVLARLNQEMSEARSQPMFLQIVDAASPPYKIKPKAMIVIVIALFGALGLSGAAIFLLANLDTSVKSVDEIEKLLGIPVLAAIPEFAADFRSDRAKKEAGETKASKEDSKDVNRRLPLLEDKHSTVSEAFRTLRASLLILEDDQPSVLMTSALPGEGKSFSSINLAVAMCQQDMRTVLVDSDLRKPVIESRLFDTKKHLGLSDYLQGRVDLDEIVRQSKIDNLDVITAGRITSNPSELLSRKARLQLLLAALQERYDRIVFDSAPVLAVSDTLSLAQHFKTISLVVRSHKTPKRYIKRAFELLARTGHPAAGTTLNLVPARAAAQYYYYYSYGKGGRTYAYGAPAHAAAE